MCAQDPGSEQLVIVLEHIDGGPLLVRAPGGRDVFVPLPESDARAVFRDMVAGLSHMHSRGISHNDLKPENMMLTAAGAVKLVDMGSAK